MPSSERVGDEIEDDLLPHLAIDVDRFADLLAGHGVGQAGGLDRRSERAREIGRQRRDIERFEAHAHAAGFDAREIEQRVHQFQQSQTVATGQIQLRA